MGTTLTKDQYGEYRRQVSLKREDNFFLLDWGWGVVRNCDAAGKLIVPGLKRLFLKSDTRLWIALKLCLFRDSEGIFGIWACEKCMIEIMAMNFRQEDRAVIESSQCHHSKVLSELGENFRKRYQDYLPNDINTLDGNQDIFVSNQCKTAIMRSEPDTHGLCLVAYRDKGKVSLLYTVGSQNKLPLCSKCRGHS